MEFICLFLCVSFTVGSFSTMFPYFFGSQPSTPRPESSRVTGTIRRAMTRRTDFFGQTGRQKQRTKLSLQVSLGPMIFPESIEQTTKPITAQNSKISKLKSKRRPIQTTTTEIPSYEEYRESEEEIVSGFTTTAPSTSKASISFMQKLRDKFPSIHNWLHENEEANGQETTENTSRQARMPRTFFTKKQKRKNVRPKHKAVHALKKPKVPTPPKRLVPPKPPPFPKTKPTAPAFEQEEDIQAAGFTPPSKRQKVAKLKATPIFEQYRAQPNPTIFGSHQEDSNTQPAGQLQSKPVKSYNYQKPKPDVSRELFFYEPPSAFAPSRPKPVRPKPPIKPKKEYKVIFIKAPEPEPPIIPDLPQIQPAPEQKTLIYVVAKKPEEPPNITLPVPAKTPTEKPDVFFIRYKVTTTTPGPDEAESEVLPGGFDPTPVPDETEQEVLPGGYETTPKPKPGYQYTKPTKKPTTTTTPVPDETEDEVLPGGQSPTEPTDSYLPPEEDEEDEVLPGGQEPGDEYLPPDEGEDEVLPGGQEPTTSTLPSTDYLPPVDEHEEEILPAGYYPTEPPTKKEKGALPGSYLKPPKPSPDYNYLPPDQSYLPKKPYGSNQYLPQPPSSFGPAWQDSSYGGYTTNPNSNYGGYGGNNQNSNYGGYGGNNQNSNYGGYSGNNQNSNYGGYSSNSQNSNYGGYPTPPPTHYFPPASTYNNYDGTKYATGNYGSYGSSSTLVKHSLPSSLKYEGSTLSNYGLSTTNSGHYNGNLHNQNHNNGRNLHTVLPPRHLSIPFRYNNDHLFHRQGTMDSDASTSLDSILFQSLGLAPVT